MSPPEPDWSRLYEYRHQAADRFGSIWDLPLRRRYHTVLEPLGAAGTRLLEIGAGDRRLEKRLSRAWGKVIYASCDIDPRHGHDFSHIHEVTGCYDIVCGFELIEHLTLADAGHLISGCLEHTSPGGYIVLTTPNIFYPPGYLRDASHRTPFCYDELAGLVSMAGYEVTAIYRLYHDSLVKKFLKRFLCYPLFRILGIDFAKQIIVVGRRPGS